MKRTLKIGYAVLIIGLVCLAIGFFTGGAKDLTIDHGQKEPVSVHHRVLTNKKFSSIDITAADADVIVKAGDHYQVSFTGNHRHQPTATVKSGRLILKQTIQSEKHSTGLFWHEREGACRVVITVPSQQVLRGKLDLSSGDLTVSQVSLTNVSLNNDSGDITLRQLTINGGHANLESGDFTASGLTLQSSYRVENSSGNNEVKRVTADGFHLKTDSGENELFNRDQDDGGSLTKNTHADRVLTLVSQSGDNEVK